MRLIKGIAAGTMGTTLLNVATYLDMTVRGRPASSVPADAVDALGVSLGRDEEQANARREALGALMGFAAGGLGGAVYGLVRPHARAVPWPLAAAATGLGVMAATDTSNALLGVSDPREWSAADWLADLLPHLAYGTGVALTFDALER